MTQDSASPGRRPDTRALTLCALAVATSVSACAPAAATPDTDAAPVAALRQNADQPVRLAGAVEAVRAFSVITPRLTGQQSNTPLVITRLVAGGARVEAGDLLVEFDPQDQQRAVA